MALITVFKKNSFSESVLNHMYKYGINNKVNLSKITKNRLNDRSQFDVVWLDVDKAIDHLFAPLIEQNYIDNYLNTTPKKLPFDSRKKYLAQVNVRASLTADGYEFLIKTKKWRLGWVTITAICAIIMAVIALFKLDLSELRQLVFPKKEAPKAHSLQKTK